MNMISTTSTAPAPVLSSASHTRSRSAASGSRAAARRPRPPANGQPEESLTCHQPISMPIRPSRGPDLPHAAAGLAELAAGDPREAVVCRARAASARAASRFAPARRRGRRSSRARRAGARRARRGPLELAEVQQPGVGARARPAGWSSPPIGNAVTNASASSRSSRAICARRRPPRRALVADVGRARAGAARSCTRKGAPCVQRCEPHRPDRQLDQPYGRRRTVSQRSVSPVRAVAPAPPRTSTAPPRRGSPARPSTPTANSATRRGRATDGVPGQRVAEQQRVDRRVGRRERPASRPGWPGRRRRAADPEAGGVDDGRRPAPRPGRRSRSARSGRRRRSRSTERNPPCSSRATAASSLGIRSTSGSSPIWRKKVR